KKRVSRAVEKLQKFFLKRGVTSTTTALAGALSANSVQAAPALLAKTATAAAFIKGAAAPASTLTLIQGALKVMAWSKAKIAIVTAVGVLLVAGTTVTTYVHLQKHAPSKEAQSQTGFIPLASWAFKGYATPEDTFQSALWAMSRGNVKSYVACLTPDY